MAQRVHDALGAFLDVGEAVVAIKERADVCVLPPVKLVAPVAPCCTTPAQTASIPMNIIKRCCNGLRGLVIGSSAEGGSWSTLMISCHRCSVIRTV